MGDTSDRHESDEIEEHAGDARDTESPTPQAPAALDDVATEEILRELQRRQRELRALLAKRARLQEQLRELEATIAELGGREYIGEKPAPARPLKPPPAAPRERRIESLPLPAAIAQLMEIGDVISPREAAERVVAGGYRTTAANFGAIVTNALSKDKRFRRVGRGRYERVA